MKINIKNELKALALTFVSAFLSVLALYTFVVPAKFSPSGIDGLCTLLYEITGLNVGYYKLMINIPLMILAWIFLNKKYVFFVMFFTLLDSVGMIIFEKVNFYVFVPSDLAIAEALSYRLMAAIFSGVLVGLCIGIMLRLGYSSGGTTVIAGLVHKWKKHLNVERVISICGYTIVAISYFVYHDPTSILLSIMQIFVTEWTISSVLRSERYAVEVKIITKEPEKIKEEILFKHKHSATVIESRGMYSEEGNYMVVTVMSSRDIPYFMNTMKKYPDTFIYFSDGVRVQGNFHFAQDKKTERFDAFQ